MMGPRQEAQGALFYEFSLEEHVPADHLLRSIDRFVDLSGIRTHLAPFYSSTGRPSVVLHGRYTAVSPSLRRLMPGRATAAFWRTWRKKASGGAAHVHPPTE